MTNKKEITEVYHVCKERLRQYCIDNNYFDLGTNRDYEAFFFNLASTKKVTLETIYKLAKMIIKFSSSCQDEGYSEEYIMFKLVYDNVVYPIFVIN